MAVFTTVDARAQDADAVRVICIGAHPDDCDVKMGGTAALLARAGVAVKFVSVTNGDAGHHEMGGGMLAKRRAEEATEAARRLGIAEYEVLDNHDGQLTNNLATREELQRIIRRWEADVVLAPRPYDYHPDHRYTGEMVQDLAYMAVVPNITPGTPPLERNPVFLYLADGFQKPAPFEATLAVGIDAAVDAKVDALDAHVSQFYEWLPWVSGQLDQVPEEAEARKAWLREQWLRPVGEEAQSVLEAWYGAEQASAFEYAETFELCEYGYQPSDEELRRLFPVFD